MRGKDLLECMEYIDDTLIEEALNPIVISHKDRNAVKWAMAVASAIVIGISATALWSHQNADRNFNMDQQENTNNDINAQMDMDMADNIVGSDAGELAAEAGFTTEITKDASAGVADNNLLTEVEKESGKDQADQVTKEPIKEKSVTEHATKSNIESLEMETQEETRLADLDMQKEIKATYKVIHDYYGEKENSEYCYAVPQKGTVLRYEYLQKTIDYYAAQENITDDSATQESITDATDNTIYAYQVVINIYGDIETTTGIQYEDLYRSDSGNLLIEQEYRRLIELGYAVRLSEDFQLTGIFTKAEMDTFLASPDYGYVFRFENES